MTWRTFGGDHADIYEAILKSRCLVDEHEITPTELSRQLRQHIYRGVGYLASSNRIANVAEIAEIAIKDIDANIEADSIVSSNA